MAELPRRFDSCGRAQPVSQGEPKLQKTYPKVAALFYSAHVSNDPAEAMATRSIKTDILTINDFTDCLRVTEWTRYQLAAP